MEPLQKKASFLKLQAFNNNAVFRDTKSAKAMSVCSCLWAFLGFRKRKNAGISVCICLTLSPCRFEFRGGAVSLAAGGEDVGAE